MTRIRPILCVAMVIAVQGASAFQYEVVNITVSLTSSGYVARTYWDQRQYPLSEVHRSLFRFAQNSANAVIVVDMPDSLPICEVAQLRDRILSAGFHQPRFYLRLETGGYCRFVIHHPKSGDLSSTVDAEIWQDVVHHILSESDFSLPPSRWLRHFLSRSLSVLLLPFWAGAPDSVGFWITITVEVLGLTLILLFLRRRRRLLNGNAKWTLPMVAITGLFFLLLFNIIAFWIRFGGMT